MATKHLDTNDHYISEEERRKLRHQVEDAGLTLGQLAFELRMSRPHVTGLMSGRIRMARYHLYAIRYILLLSHARSKM